MLYRHVVGPFILLQVLFVSCDNNADMYVISEDDWDQVNVFVNSVIADDTIATPSYPFIEKYVMFRYLAHLKLGYINISASDVKYVRKPLPIFNLFDWVIYPDNMMVSRYQRENPRTILCRCTELQLLHDSLDILPPLEMNQIRSLVIAGTDTRLSAVIDSIDFFISSGKFSGIWVEGKDIYREDIKTPLCGINIVYLLRAGMGCVEKATKRAQDVMSTDELKMYLVCAAWGSVYGQLDNHVDSRRNLIHFLMNNSHWITRSQWSYEEYWANLPDYKFMLSPPGNGVQSSKLYECWLVRTVPVTIRSPAAVDLQSMGFPMVLVDNWDMITSDRLEYWYENHGIAINWTNVWKLMETESFMETISTTRTLPFR